MNNHKYREYRNPRNEKLKVMACEKCGMVDSLSQDLPCKGKKLRSTILDGWIKK